jgi:hypothetical protein
MIRNHHLWFDLPPTRRNEHLYVVSLYCHRHSNHIWQRETKTSIMLWCILLDIQINITKEKWRDVCYHQGFLLWIKSPSTMRNDNLYNAFQYFHQRLNHVQQRETKTYRMTSGILIDIQITFNKEQWILVCSLQPFSSMFKYYRHGETKTCMMFPGILIDMCITFNKEKRRHVWCPQEFSSIFESPSPRSKDDMYNLFRYSHPHSNHLRQWETKTHIMTSGILILTIIVQELGFHCANYQNVITGIIRIALTIILLFNTSQVVLPDYEMKLQPW